MKGTIMETGHELFLHELKDMLDAEQQLVKVLEENANDSSRPELEKAFRQHGKETEGHVKRLEQCFELLDEEPETDRKSTRLNSSHPSISYAVFCLKNTKFLSAISKEFTRWGCLFPKSLAMRVWFPLLWVQSPQL